MDVRQEEWQCNGPFEILSSGGDGCEIINSDGIVICWTVDRSLALIVAGLLERFVAG